MNIQSLSTDDAFSSLLSSCDGLTEAEAGRRLVEFGHNEIRETPGKPLYLRFVAQFVHFLAVLLWIAAALCFVSEALHPGEGLLTLGIAILGVIVINALFTFIQEYRAEKAFQELKKLLPYNVTVLREGVKKEIPASLVVPGDLLFLEEGSRVPADSRLVDVTGLLVNNAPLTGESDSRPRDSNRYEGDYFDSPNIVFAGTLVISGRGTALAYATGMATEFGKIAHLTSGVIQGLSPLQKEIVRVTRIVASIAVATGIVLFAAGFFIGRSFWENFLFAIGIIIANVPEGLLPTVTLSLAMGSQRMAKKKVLIKNLNAVETLGSVNVICTDKTGTLTQNRMAVKTVWAAGDEDRVKTIAALCNNASCKKGMEFCGDPTEAALLAFAGIEKRESSKRVAEIPFDGSRKRMTTVDERADGYLYAVKGAYETVISLCSRVDGPSSTTRAVAPPDLQDIEKQYYAMADRGLRVLAFAYKQAATLDLETAEKQLVFAGLIGLEDPPRPEVPDAMRKCRDAGIRVIMITGDGGRTAVAIGREIGLVGESPVVTEGRQLSLMSDRELSELLAGEDLIFSRMTPQHKMRIVGTLMEKGFRVAVTGDGVNDAPALKKADIGISMGIAGTDVAKEAADIVLLDDNFATIVAAVEEGRAIFENIRNFITYIFASNIPELVPYLAYVLLGIPLPLTIIQILAVDLGTDMFPALALGSEKPVHDLMQRPPRRADERLLDWKVLSRAYLFLGPVEAAAGMFSYFIILYGSGWQWGSTLAASDPLYLTATTACLGAIIVMQMANVFACRSSVISAFAMDWFSNRLILAGVAAEVIITILIIYTGTGNSIFGTAPLPFTHWLVLLPFAVALLIADSLYKRVQKQRVSA